MGVQENLYPVLLETLFDGVYFLDRERRITAWNAGAEHISGFSRERVIGAYCQDRLLMHVDDSGRRLCGDGCPILATLTDGQARQAEVYLHHADGHRVPVTVRAIPIHDTGGEITGAVEVFKAHPSAAGALEHWRDGAGGRDRLNDLQVLKKVALQDPLTGVGNRRYTEVRLETSLEEYHRHGLGFGVLFIDIDHFKNINDTFGHASGDRVLRMVANTLLHNLRATDYIGRWGGDEFLVLLSGVKEDGLGLLAEKLRMLVEQSFLTVEPERGHANEIRVTISAGVAGVLQEDLSPETLVRRADQGLYRSKTGGRNRVSFS